MPERRAVLNSPLWGVSGGHGLAFAKQKTCKTSYNLPEGKRNFFCSLK